MLYLDVISAIEARRKELNVSKAEIARSVYASRNSVSSWLNMTYAINLDAALAILHYLGLDIQIVYKEDEKMIKVDSNSVELRGLETLILAEAATMLEGIREMLTKNHGDERGRELFDLTVRVSNMKEDELEAEVMEMIHGMFKKENPSFGEDEY